jgi:diguanylate cyclase (GGDEF)-like protein
MPTTSLDHAQMEARETSGLTSRLILSYVEREKGAAAVKAVLRRCGLEDREERLRDENYWFDFQTKIRLFEAAAAELDDPDVSLHVGAAALDLNVAPGVKLAIRAFGNPRLVYANIVRASGKFTWAHRWEVQDLSAESVRLRYTDAAGVGYHRLDCQYNQGLLSCVPAIFGMPPASIEHDRCAVEGADACVYDVRWAVERSGRVALATGLAVSCATVLAAALTEPSLVPAAAAAPAAGAAALWRRQSARLRRRCRGIEAQVREQREVADRLSRSLGDLVSNLHLDEVLTKITENARAAVVGKEFVLLARDGRSARCLSSSGIPPGAIEAIEQWATDAHDVFDSPLLLEDLATVPSLARLARDASMPIGSLRSAPLVFKDQRVGALVALAHGPEAFFPQDATLLESYAAQAAIALSNAHLVERLEQQASQDPLTGLLNHREFHQAVDREIDRCERYEGRFSVMVLDLDGFKHVNDEYGHAHGDKVLRAVAEEIRTGCRSSDLACRIGGDEFAVIFPESTARSVITVAERIQAAVCALDAAVTLSFGIAEWPADGPTKDLLLLRADLALYSQKPSRRQRRSFVSGSTATELTIRSENAHARLVLDRLTRQACEALEVEKAAVFVPDEDDPDMTTGAAGYRVPVDFLRERHVRDGITGRVLSRGEPTVIFDYNKLAHRIHHEAVNDLRAVASVPLRWGGKVHGALWAGTTDAGRRLGDRDLKLLAELADVGAVSLENAHIREQLDQTVQAGVEAMALAVDLHDSYTAHHSEKVVELACKVGRRLGLDPNTLIELEFAARLHDLGKIGVPDRILQKPGNLGDSEWEVMHQHPIWGEEILKRIPGLANVARIVRAEHERWDGQGYPDGLRGDEIPLSSRIIFACDAYHAMTSDRPYRPALEPQVAQRELLATAGSQFDPAVVEALMEALVVADAGDGLYDEAVPARVGT